MINVSNAIKNPRQSSGSGGDLHSELYLALVKLLNGSYLVHGHRVSGEQSEITMPMQCWFCAGRRRVPMLRYGVGGSDRAVAQVFSGCEPGSLVLAT